GGVIGFEREVKDRPAGFRTHVLVAGAAALLGGLAGLLAVRYTGEQDGELVRGDRRRLIEAVVAGCGFVGARALFRGGGEMVTGITTAASLLMVAAIGIAVGVHAHLLAFGTTVLTLVVLLLLAWAERRAGTRRPRAG